MGYQGKEMLDSHSILTLSEDYMPYECVGVQLGYVSFKIELTMHFKFLKFLNMN